MKLAIACSLEWPSFYLLNRLQEAGCEIEAVYVQSRSLNAQFNLSSLLTNRNTLGWTNALSQFLGRPSLFSKERSRISDALGPLRSVKDLKRSNLKLVPVASFRSQEFAETLRQGAHDLVLITGASVLPRRVADAAQRMTLRIHTSVLPHYRGGGSLFWPLFFKDYEKVGYTILQVAAEQDVGPVIHQQQVNIDPKEDSQVLQLHVYRSAADELIRRLQSDELTPLEQQPTPIDFVFKQPNDRFRRLYQHRHEGPLRTLARRMEYPLLKRLKESEAPTITVMYAHRLLPDDLPADDWRRILGHATVSETRELITLMRRTHDFISIPQLMELHQQGEWVDRPSLVLSYDDGYEDFFSQGTDLFEELKVPAALFLSTAVLEGHVPYHQRAYDLINGITRERLIVPWMDSTLYFGDSTHRVLTVEYVLLPYLKNLSPAARERQLDELFTANEVDPALAPEAFCTPEQVVDSKRSSQLSVMLHGHR
ncbi:MAG: formyltransferase family protein, partial [Pseudomonadota bacterium]